MLEMNVPVALQWLGCVFGLAGAWRLAVGGKGAGVGFVLFLVSNAFWIVFAIVTSAPGLLVMQLGFTATSLLGVYRWMVVPWQHERSLMPARSLTKVPRAVSVGAWFRRWLRSRHGQRARGASLRRSGGSAEGDSLQATHATQARRA